MLVLWHGHKKFMTNQNLLNMQDARLEKHPCFQR